MGAGASSVNASTFLSADPDDEALLSVLCQDVTGAQRLLRQVERLMPVAEARCADVPAEDAERAQPSKTKEEVVAEGNMSRCKLSIHGMDGSSFQVAVEDATTVNDLSRIIVAQSSMSCAGRALVLTSGGHVLDHSKPLLQQVTGEEVTFVARKVSAGEAAVSLQRALEGDASPIDGIVSLVFDDEFDQSLEGVTFPSSLQTLTFAYSFNESLKGVALPSSLLSLTFGSRFNQSLEGVTLPSSLQTLTFGDRFNKSLADVTLPSSLQSLTFGCCFDQSLETVIFPTSLHTLTFGSEFNQRLEGGKLPSGLQTLTFGVKFNQCLEGVTFPSSLQTLSFSDSFNQSLKDVTLPSGLRTLTFGQDFNQSLEGVTFPNSLETLTFGHCFDQCLDGVTFSTSLHTLTFGDSFDQSLEGVTFPNSLETLTFGHCFDQSLEGVTWPVNLQTLTFGHCFDQSLDGVTLASSLQTLTFGYCFNKSLRGVMLPSSLQTLTFGYMFNRKLNAAALPDSLQTLTFGFLFNQSLEGVTLPSSLQTLSFGAYFNQSLEGVIWPSSLQTLTFAEKFNQSLEGVDLPSSLRSLTFGTAVATARRQRSPVLLERSKEAEDSCVSPAAKSKSPTRPVLFSTFTSLTGDSEARELATPAQGSASPSRGDSGGEGNNDEESKPNSEKATPRLKLSRIQSTMSAPARFVYLSPERKRHVLQRSEYLESSMTSSYMQIHDFHPLPTWAREAKNERDPSATIRISGEAKLPSSGDFADDVTGGAMVIQEQAAKGHLMIFPSSPRKMTWDVFGATLIVYDLFTISMQVFDPPETDFTKSMQIYWTMNMLVSCMVGYIDKGIFVMVPIKVFLHYLKTWFIIDLVVVGSDWAFSLSESTDNAGSSVKLLRSLRLFRMVRLIRILRLRKTMESVSDLVDSEYISIIVSIFKMLALLMIVNHVIACFWFWIGDSAGGWIEMHHLLDEQWEYQYATSLHWAITQFTPASMHIQPQNLHERLFALGVVVFALVGFSYVVGSISGSLAQLRGMTENRARQFWELRRHLRKNKYVEHVLESQEENVPAEDIKLLTLLSEQLRSELECEICMPHFSVHPLFARLCVVSRHTIHRLANNAIQKKQLARSGVGGETATHMYIVVYGRLIYSRIDSKGNEHKELVDKGEDWISEPVLWTDSWIHLGLLISMTESDLMVLDPLHFGRIVNLNPDAAALAHTYVMNFIKWINSVPRDSLSDIWQGENVGPRVAGFMELDENQFRSAKSLAAKLMNWQK
eukprot:g13116.t1